MFRYIGVEGNTTFYDDPPLDRKRLFFLQNRKLFSVFSGFFGFSLWGFPLWLSLLPPVAPVPRSVSRSGSGALALPDLPFYTTPTKPNHKQNTGQKLNLKY